MNLQHIFGVTSSSIITDIILYDTVLACSCAHCCRWFDHIGLAIFYDTDKFDLLDQYAFIMNKKVDDVFSGYGVSPATMAAIAEHMERSSAFEDIISPPGCLMVRLRHKSTGRQICVSNVHVTWKEFKCPVLQLLQVARQLILHRELSSLIHRVDHY